MEKEQTLNQNRNFMKFKSYSLMRGSSKPAGTGLPGASATGNS